MAQKILVVDDDPDIIEAVTMILEARGFTTVKARNGVEGLEKIKSEKPELVILDLLMPKMDGFTMFKTLQESKWSEYKDIPVLILTSVREDASRRRYELETGKELSADDYLEKPFAPEILLVRVTNLLRKKSRLMREHTIMPKAKILLVDDDQDFVASTKTVLESKPYDVVVAYNGNEGLEKAKTENPDLIILDVIMPMKDGFTAAEQFKKDPQLSKIPIIMLTSYSTQRSGTAIPVSAGYSLEAEDYIDKPIEPEELLKVVEKYIKK
jgi:CheY-like chemotaxis protein